MRQTMALKDELLKEFAGMPDEYVSGEALAENYHVSRAAVWKAVQALRREGWKIESSPVRGYCFTGANDFLSRDLIVSLTPDIDAPVYVFDEIGSTNTYAKQLCAMGTAHGTLVVADHQTAGRGRQGHSFYSPKQTGLYFSLVIHPDNGKMISRITPAAAVAAVEAIDEVTGIHPGIKWVNDLFLEKRKIAGILTEAVTDFETGRIEAAVIGIGINCKGMEFPEEIASLAGSLNAEKLSRSVLAASLRRHLLERTAALDEEVMALYRRDSIVLGKEITYERNGCLYEGIAEAINDAGNLIIKKPDGSQEVLQSGEISIKSW